jgi:tRNA(fMet)-specific endonuclease VapC
MSGKNYLLDTNIIIGLFANDPSIIEKIKSHPSGIFIPSIVLGELFYGAAQSGKKEENKKKIEALAIISSILDCDLDTARLYGEIKSQLKVKGAPIPENDIRIAALTQQHNLILVTRDKHFKNIEVLPIERW